MKKFNEFLTLLSDQIWTIVIKHIIIHTFPLCISASLWAVNKRIQTDFNGRPKFDFIFAIIFSFDLHFLEFAEFLVLVIISVVVF